MRYYEDIVEGTVHCPAEEHELSKDEIVEFCSEWDPMPFHVNEDAAARTPIGKLFTSALHSIAIALRLGHRVSPEPWAVIAGLGWDEVRFLAPICAGDRLRLRMTILEKRASEGNADRGIVRSGLEMLNQRDEVALSMTTAVLMHRRPESDPAG